METPLEKEIQELNIEIAKLPMGHIVKEVVCGKEYYFRQIGTDDHIVYKVYVDPKALDDLRTQIAKREELENRQEELISQLPTSLTVISENFDPFETDIYVKERLSALISGAALLRRRDRVSEIKLFLSEPGRFDVLLLSGMKGAGNTIMMYQTIADMTDADFGKTALMRVKGSESFMNMLHDIKKLRRLGYSYLFVDDVTNSSDFLSGAGFFARNAEQYGFKMVISGSDSLSIVFAKDNALYEQCFLLSTTFIPFREFERVLGPTGIDEYLTIAGTMNPGPAKSRRASREYISVSIAENIQNSLENYRYGGFFSHTDKLHEDGKLIDAICDVVDEFTRQFLVRALDASVMSERKDIHTEIFSRMLKILGSAKYRCRIGEYVIYDIRWYLKDMDVLYETNWFEISNHCEKKTVDVTSQQWLVYARAAFLIENLLKRSEFASLSAEEKDIVRGELLDSIKATLMEDTVLLETKLAKPATRVWGLSATAGEPHCMVVEDKENSTVFVYELVHGERGPSNRFGALHMYSEIERIFGKMTERRVLYLGETTDARGTPYINVEEYLRAL